MQEEIPYHTIYRILKSHINNPITKEYVIQVKKHLEEIIKQIAESSLQELEQSNELRQFHNLPTLNRIHTPKVLYNPDTYTGMVPEDEHNKDTQESQAVEIT